MIDYLKYIGFCLIIFLCRILPGRFLYWIALRVSDLNYLFDRNGREAVKCNLRQVLPEATEERIIYETRWAFRNFGKYLTEFFRFRIFNQDWFKKHVAFRGWDIVENTLAQGKGAILLSAHLSNWELGAAGVSMLGGHKATVVVAMHRYGKVNNLFMRERLAMGLNVVDMRTAPRAVMRELRNNGVVCILGDRDPTEQGIEIEFFGRPCRFPQGPARFSLKTGAPIIPCFALRRTNDSFTVWFEDPIPIPEGGDSEENVRAVTQAFARNIEEAIRWHPEEWSVFYDVWDGGWRP